MLKPMGWLPRQGPSRLPIRLLAGLLTGLLCGVLAELRAAQALPVDRVNQIAQQITVQIDGEHPGSGVLIGHQGDRYTVVTAHHVVAVQDRYAVITPDGQRHPLERIEPIADTDLALVQFRSPQSYKLAQLADYVPVPQQYLFLSGYPAPLEAVSEKIRLFIPGHAVAADQAILLSQDPLSQGYRLFYANIADAGMSGGAVLDTDGRVLGIHGRTEGEAVSGAGLTDRGQSRRLRLGFSSGMPIGHLAKSRPDLRLVLQSGPPTVDRATAQTIDQRLSELAVPPVLVASSPANDSPSGASALSWANYSNLLYRLQRLPDALKAINQALELQFRVPQIWYTQGTVLAALGRQQEALNAFDRSTQLNPQFYPAWQSKALVQMAMGQSTEALASLQQLLKLRPQSYVAWYLQGQVLGQPDRAPLSSPPPDPNADPAPGPSDLSAALAAYDRAVALEPEFALAWRARAQVLQRLNRLPEALASVDQALVVEPADRASQSLKQTLRQQTP
jgi:Flp pilus assembly protein TadD